MKKYILIVLALIFCIPASFSARTSLAGRFTDSKTGEALFGANIYFPDLKTGTVSGADGSYKIENLPFSKVLLQVSCQGYKSVIEIIDLSVVTVKDFPLEVSITEIHEVVIDPSNSQSMDKNRI